MNGINKGSFLPFLFAAVIAVTSPRCRGSTLSQEEQARQDAVVAKEQADIHSTDARRRMHAFDVITNPLRDHNGFGRLHADTAAPSTKLAVTELLKVELDDNPVRSAEAAKVDESIPDIAGMTEEWEPSLIRAVAELHDPSSIPLLYHPSILTSGGMATSALAYFGHTEARKVLDLYHQYMIFERHPMRAALGGVIVCMLSRRTLDDPKLLNEVEQLLLSQSFARDYGDRDFAAIGLSYFRDEKAQARLREMAKSDPLFLAQRKVYPIRDIAQTALKGPFRDDEER